MVSVVDVFFDNSAATSGPYVGSYLWSDALNWSDGVPGNGYTVVVSATGADDLASLTLSSLVVANSSLVDVVGDGLTIGSLSLQGQLIADSARSGTPVTVIVSAILGATSDSVLGAVGVGSFLIDQATFDPGLSYLASAGGFVEVASAPSDDSIFVFDQGTFAFATGPGTFGALLANAASGDVLEVPGTTVVNVTFGTASLNITTDLGTFDFTNVNYAGFVDSYTATLDPVSQLLAVTLACYCAGTAILTVQGEVAVEELEAGDMVMTADGQARPVRWIGRRSYAGRFLRAAALPVRIRAGALGEGLPRRDLRVSPAHAMFLDGILVPAEALLNGTTVVRDGRMERVDYFHIELDDHDVLLAEGAASETYVEDGSRGIFANAGEYSHRPASGESAQPRYCAPRVDSGWQLDAIRRRLAVPPAVTAQAA